MHNNCQGSQKFFQLKSKFCSLARSCVLVAVHHDMYSRTNHGIFWQVLTTAEAVCY